MAKDKELKQSVVLDLGYSPSDPKAKIQVVSWNNSPPKLEKRFYYSDESDDLKPGKVVAFTYEDFKLLLSKKTEIKEALSAKTEEAPVKKSKSKKEELKDSEVEPDQKPKKKKQVD